MENPVDRRVSSADPARGRQQSDGQVGSRPLEVDRVEMQVAQPLRNPLEGAASLAPGSLGIVFVQAAHIYDLLPELVERGLRLEVGENEPGPFLGGPRRYAPVDRALVDDRRPFLHPGEDVPAEPRRIQIVEEMRLERAAEGDRRPTLLAELQSPFAVPGRDEVQHIVWRVEHALPLEMRIPVVDIDEFRAAPVGTRRDGARELFLPEPREEVEDLTLLHVRAEADDQVGEAFYSRGHGQAMLLGPRMALHGDDTGHRAFPQLAGAQRRNQAFLSA